MQVQPIQSEVERDQHLCWPVPDDADPSQEGMEDHTELFDAADTALTIGSYDDPVIQKAADICLKVCTEYESCLSDAKLWLKRKSMRVMDVEGDPPYLLAGHILYIEHGKRKMEEVIFDPPAEVDNPDQEDVPNLEEFAESRARRALSEREAAVSERLTAKPAAFHELLGVIRVLNPKAEPKDLLKILADLKLRLMNDKQGPQLARSERTFGDKTSFNMYGIGASQDELGKAAEDLHAIESGDRETDMTRLPAKNSQPAKELLLSFETFCGENDDFFITFKKGSILAFVEHKNMYKWKELLGAPTTYHLIVLRHLMQAERPTDIKEMYQQLTGQNTTSPSDRRFVEFEIAATLMVEICRRAKVLQMSNSMCHPRDASGMWLLRKMKRETE